MLRKTHCVLFALVIALVAIPALAGDNGGGILESESKQFRSKITADLNQCAEAQGIALEPEDATILTNLESSAAFIPVANIGYLTRAHLADWTTIGVFSAAGPADAEAPSGTFSVQVMAPLGSTKGQFQVIDEGGNVVQAGQLEIDEDPDAESPAGMAQEMPTKVTNLIEDKAYYAGCPWYYPYTGPYYFRYWPSYKYGCYRWYYRWWWGHLHFRYCWWPSRYCHRCCW